MFSIRANISRSPILRLTYRSSPFLLNIPRPIHAANPRATASSVRSISITTVCNKKEENEFFAPPPHLAESKIARTEVAWKHPMQVQSTVFLQTEEHFCWQHLLPQILRQGNGAHWNCPPPNKHPIRQRSPKRSALPPLLHGQSNQVPAPSRIRW